MVQHIICPQCSRRNLNTNSFCIYCGIRLSERFVEDVESEQLADVPVGAVPEILENETVADQDSSSKSNGNGASQSIPLQSRLKLNRLENLFGSNWLVRIGVVAIFIGISFLMKLAIDENMLTQEVLVLAGVI